MKRKAVDEAREVKNAMVSGLWSNTNYDEKNYRKKALEDIDNSFHETINIIYNGSEEYEVDMDQPLFAAIPDDLK